MRLILLLLLVATSTLSCQSSINIYTVPKEESQKESSIQVELSWTAPPSWKEKALSEFRKASFEIQSHEGKADFSVVAFPGDAGGLLANINRWRGQLQLPPFTEETLRRAIRNETHQRFQFKIVYFEGKNKEAILAAILSHADQTWFFKLSGPSKLVSNQRRNFTLFLESLR